ncbi:glutaminase B [Aliikangiella coralliicola]|uniref:Glutaminase n=1 Tax=Aliikangiella coralliicola TaxID=2592383 RepID=A0A545U647_9GAMM|nr:glutaminase B [Aliikangiella coralliicola]TQV84951.1 glutaminase B [Aliikangiella coralliicola]
MKNINETLEKILQKVTPLIGQGKTAAYIPALANINPNQLGIAICDINGKVYSAGDANTPFSIQSICKVFTLSLALKIYDSDIWQRVGREPSGQKFNSLIQLESEQGIPRNPFINAGALLICDMLESRCSAPNYQLLELLRKLSGNYRIKTDAKVARSEMQHSARNAAVAYLMKSYQNFDNNVETVLESYAHHCAIEMNCIELAKASIYLANKGSSLDSKVQVLSAEHVKKVNAVLATCGLYDASGDFAFRVGLPGKSGVGGGIIAIIPGRYSVCVWSPELNEAGNSLAGTAALELLSQALDSSVF